MTSLSQRAILPQTISRRIHMSYCSYNSLFSGMQTNGAFRDNLSETTSVSETRLSDITRAQTPNFFCFQIVPGHTVMLFREVFHASKAFLNAEPSASVFNVVLGKLQLGEITTHICVH